MTVIIRRRVPHATRVEMVSRDAQLAISRVERDEKKAIITTNLLLWEGMQKQGTILVALRGMRATFC